MNVNINKFVGMKLSKMFLQVLKFYVKNNIVIENIDDEKIANKIYDEANGFVNLSLLILLSIAMITILPLKHAEVNLIKTRIQKEQIKNIGKVLHVSIVTSGLVSGIISVLLFFFSTKLLLQLRKAKCLSGQER